MDNSNDKPDFISLQGCCHMTAYHVILITKVKPGEKM